MNGRTWAASTITSRWVCLVHTYAPAALHHVLVLELQEYRGVFMFGVPWRCVRLCHILQFETLPSPTIIVAACHYYFEVCDYDLRSLPFPKQAFYRSAVDLKGGVLPSGVVNMKKERYCVTCTRQGSFFGGAYMHMWCQCGYYVDAASARVVTANNPNPSCFKY